MVSGLTRLDLWWRPVESLFSLTCGSRIDTEAMDLVTIILIVAGILLVGVFVVAIWGRLALSTRTISALSVIQRKLLGLSKTGPANGPELFSDDK